MLLLGVASFVTIDLVILTIHIIVEGIEGSFYASEAVDAELPNKTIGVCIFAPLNWMHVHQG